MGTLFKFGLAAAVTYIVVDALFKRLETDDDKLQDFIDAANPPSSIDEIPTLRAMDDDDLNVAENAPL